ncbi:hypothetical protein GCM10017706_26860 [Lactococcus lactis subsp. hordniae]
MIIKTINLENYKEVTELIRESFSQSEHGYGNEAELVDKIVMKKVISKFGNCCF